MSCTVSDSLTSSRPLMHIHIGVTRSRENIPCKNKLLVSRWDATHCSSAKALQTRFDACAVSEGGDNRGYMDTIS